MVSKSLRTLGVLSTVKNSLIKMTLTPLSNAYFFKLIIFTIGVGSVVTYELLIRIRRAPPSGASVGGLRRILSNHSAFCTDLVGLRGVLCL